MLRKLLEQRTVIAMLIATGVGALGVHAYPIDRGNVYLQLIELRSPAVFLVLVYGYATLWFTTPFFATSILTSLATIVAYRLSRQRTRPTAADVRATRETPITDARARRNAFRNDNGTCAGAVVADDPATRALHRRDDSRRSRDGQDVGLHVSLRRATSALAGGRSESEDRRPRARSEGRLLPASAQACSAAPDARSDYAEIGLGGDVCYNPLHNDLDPYAVAFAIATLVNNLFGKSKEPFWQQAYTDLLKFVILLAASRRRLHDVRGGVPLHPRRHQDRERTSAR